MQATAARRRSWCGRSGSGRLIRWVGRRAGADREADRVDIVGLRAAQQFADNIQRDQGLENLARQFGFLTRPPSEPLPSKQGVAGSRSCRDLQPFQ